MKTLAHLLLVLSPLVGLTDYAMAEPSGDHTLARYSWAELLAQRPVGDIVTDETIGDVLKLVSDLPAGQTFALAAIDSPGITDDNFAFHGQVRYEDVQGEGYLEMWVVLPDSRRYFSRTLASGGPMGKLTGTTEDWRDLMLPFRLDADMPRPARLEINLVLPGTGTVYIGPLRLAQAEPVVPPPVEGVFVVSTAPAAATAPATTSAAKEGWWSGRSGMRIRNYGGAAMGVLLGLAGALIGAGKARGVINGILMAVLLAGLAALVAGLAALSFGQPYGVFYPLMILGLGGTILSAVLLPLARQRFARKT